MLEREVVGELAGCSTLQSYTNYVHNLAFKSVVPSYTIPLPNQSHMLAETRQLNGARPSAPYIRLYLRFVVKNLQNMRVRCPFGGDWAAREKNMLA